MHKITFNTIKCILPSAGVEISSTQAYDNVSKILKSGLDIAGDVIDIAVPEGGEIVSAGLEIIGDLVELGADIANLVVAIERNVRQDGGDPDQFYISWGRTGFPVEAESDPSPALYPLLGVNPTHGANNVSLAANTYAPNMPFSYTTLGVNINSTSIELIPTSIYFWDWDLDSGDDLLFSFVLDDAHCGSFKKTLYNGLQDCAYYVDYTIEVVS